MIDVVRYQILQLSREPAGAP